MTPIEKFTTNVYVNMCSYEKVGINGTVLVFKRMMAFIVNISDAVGVSCAADDECKTKFLYSVLIST